MPAWVKSLLDLEGIGWHDALDILLVACLVYAAVAILRRTRGVAVAAGLLAFILIWRLVSWLELVTLGTIFELAAGMLPLVVVVMFQNHIRRALMALGRLPLVRLFGRNEEERVVEAVAAAAEALSAQGWGALVAFERAVGLRTWIESGVALDARASKDLLVALFAPKSPLHDGAVVISHGRVVAAGCLLPLSQKARGTQGLGSRHRAALGLSEETDALVVVVSEERGTVTLVQDGDLEVVPRGGLRDRLLLELAARTPPEDARGAAAARA
jgi:diadenylate cyclase